MSLDRQLGKFRADVAAIGEAVYRNLLAEERFRLVVQAEAADDQAEVKRLLETCPRKTYTMRDAAVVDRLERLGTVVLAFCLDLAVPLAKVSMLKGQALLLDYLRNRENDELCQAWWNGYTFGLGGTEAPEDEALPMPDDAAAADWFLGVTERLTHTLEAVVLEQWEAFSRFCREDLALEPETVLAACMAPALKKVQEALGEMEGIQADPAKVEEHRGILGELWRRLAGLEE